MEALLEGLTGGGAAAHPSGWVHNQIATGGSTATGSSHSPRDGISSRPYSQGVRVPSGPLSPPNTNHTNDHHSHHHHNNHSPQQQQQQQQQQMRGSGGHKVADVPPLPRAGDAPASASAAATDRESFYAHVLAEGPTAEEVAARATPAYVRSLMSMIDSGAKDSAAVLRRLDELAEAREKRHEAERAMVRQQLEELQGLRQQVAQAALQLQEERERATRLLHENTVLHAHEAEQRERVAALVDLARRRGRALQQRRAGGSRPEGPRPTPPTPTAAASATATGAGATTATTTTFSLRAVTGGAARQRQQQNLLRTVDGGSSPSQPPAALSLAAAAATAATATTPSSSAAACDDDGCGAVSDDVQLLEALRPSSSAAAAQLLALTEEVRSLRQQLDEQRAVYEGERGLRLQEEHDAHLQQRAALAHAHAAVQQLEGLHESALRELVTYRHATSRQLRDLGGQNDWLRQAVGEAITAAETARRQHHVAATAMERRASERVRPLVRSMSLELGTRRQQSQDERHAFEAAVAERDETIARLRESVSRERALRKRAEARHRLDVQGVRSELDLMRQSLRQVETKVFFGRAREAAAAAAAEEQALMNFYHATA